VPDRAYSNNDPSGSLSNAQIAEQLMVLAQLLATRRENPFKIKAYRRAARTIRVLGESVSDLVRDEADLTEYSGIGPAIASVIREIVQTGSLRQIEALRSQLNPEVAEITEYPGLDLRRVARIYNKLGIASIAELKEKLASGDIGRSLGARMDQHVRQAVLGSHGMLLYEAETLVSAVEEFLLSKCNVTRAEVVGDFRRRVEVITEISFLIETDDLPKVLAKLGRYGGKADLLSAGETAGVLQLSSGVLLRIDAATRTQWGLALVTTTGSADHLRGLQRTGRNLQALSESEESNSDETAVYQKLGLNFIPPELREGHDEIELAASNRLAGLVTVEDVRGELHAHSTSSDGANTIEEMAVAAGARGLQYIGMSDHSRSLKIARGLSEQDLWNQIRFIDKLNESLEGIRVLKSAEVDILADGTLDYSDDLLKELDYTICSIHSRFGFGKAEQTERILRAMDNRYFNILGHPTGRLLLKRPGYEIDVERVIERARQNGCFFEINSSPDRLDLSADNARVARQAGIKIAITTDAHSTHDFDYLQYGIDQARRAGIGKEAVLNHLPWIELERLFRR
jgi:DNA polymerase (family X)